MKKTMIYLDEETILQLKYMALDQVCRWRN